MNTMNGIRSAAIAALVMLPAVAGAQWNASRFDAGRSWVYSSYGLDPAFVATIGYARVVPVITKVQLAAEVGAVMAKPDLRDSRASLGAKATVLQWRSVRLTGAGSFVTKQTSNQLYRAVSMGAATNWTLGAYRPGWFAATEGGFDKSIVTHITNSEWYRTNFYPDAKDGWYMTSAGTYRLGLMAGATLGRTELVARVGAHRSERFNDLMTPFYASLGAGYALR